VSGVAVVRYLLANDAGVLAIVPATRIKAGHLPLNTVLPAISITLVSSVQRLTVAMTETPHMQTDRVQVAWLFKLSEGTPAGAGYPGVRNMDALVRAALPNQHGTINTFTVDSILPDLAGPDLLMDDESIQQGSRDFIVKWLG
jgi:hypothetical protein